MVTIPANDDSSVWLSRAPTNPVTAGRPSAPWLRPRLGVGWPATSARIVKPHNRMRELVLMMAIDRPVECGNCWGSAVRRLKRHAEGKNPKPYWPI
jgi:hypothetical protein